MKRFCVTLIVISLIVLFFVNQSHAISQLTQLDHKSFGGRAEQIAAKLGTNVDTFFVSVGTEILVYAVNHSNPSNPTELTSLKISVNYYKINAIATNPNNSLILIAVGGLLSIRDYKTQTEYSALGTGQVKSVIFNNIGNKAFATDGSMVWIIDLTNPSSPVCNYMTLSNYAINSLAFKGSGGQDTLFTAGNGYKGLRGVSKT